MVVILLLGKDDKYMSHKLFKTIEEAEDFIESIENLMLANIEKVLSLKERLDRYCPKYFLFAGAIQDFEIIVTKGANHG